VEGAACVSWSIGDRSARHQRAVAVIMFLSLFGCLGSYELTEHNVPFLIFTLYICLHHFNVHVRRRSTRRRTIASVATYYHSSTLLLAHSFMRYARSHGSAHASLSLDVSVAATPIPHPKSISPYITPRHVSIHRQTSVGELYCQYSVNAGS